MTLYTKQLSFLELKQSNAGDADTVLQGHERTLQTMFRNDVNIFSLLSHHADLVAWEKFEVFTGAIHCSICK